MSEDHIEENLALILIYDGWQSFFKKDKKAFDRLLPRQQAVIFELGRLVAAQIGKNIWLDIDNMPSIVMEKFVKIFSEFNSTYVFLAKESENPNAQNIVILKENVKWY